MFNLRINHRYDSDGETLHECLLKRSCVGHIEGALRSSSNKLEALLSMDLGMGGVVGLGDLRSLFPQVRDKVDSYLGVGMIREPPVMFGRYSAYHNGSVYVQSGKLAWVVPALAHEYCHHVQVDYVGSNDLLPALCEGHAVGVEHHVSKRFAEESGNAAFLVYPIHWQVSRLKASYQWVCLSLGIRPDKALIACGSESDRCEIGFLRRNGRPTSHAIGTAFFTLVPTVFKESAYKEFLTGSLYF